MFALYVAPLCPAGHLPHKGGDWPAAYLALALQRRRLAKASMTANLPPCGGDVRQDRGGREGTPSFQASPILSSRAPSNPSGKCVAATKIPPSSRCARISAANCFSDALSSPAVGSSRTKSSGR